LLLPKGESSLGRIHQLIPNTKTRRGLNLKKRQKIQTVTKCRNIPLKSDLKRNAVNEITQKLHCTGAVDRERATLCRFITLDVFSLRSTVKLIKTCSVRENVTTRILNKMQIILNAQESNAKRIPKGTLMNLK